MGKRGGQMELNGNKMVDSCETQDNNIHVEPKGSSIVTTKRAGTLSLRMKYGQGYFYCWMWPSPNFTHHLNP